MLLLDTLPLVDFFKNQPENITQMIRAAEQGKYELGISVVTISELLYILSHHAGMEFAKVCIDNLKPQVNVINIDEELAEKAGELKFRYAKKGKKGMPLADCMIAATALKNNAILVTNDEHFKKVKGLKIEWI